MVDPALKAARVQIQAKSLGAALVLTDLELES